MAADPGVARARRIFFLLVALAVLLRASYLLEYTKLPFLDAPLFDSIVYLRQAQAVRAGELGHPTLLAFSPLYGYFLAAASEIAIMLQLAMGVGVLFVLRAVVGRAFDAPTALVACGLYLGYGLLLFYESKVGAETLGFALLVVAFERWTSEGFVLGRARVALAAGALLGLATLARANLLLSLPFFAIAAALPWSRAESLPSARGRLMRAGALVLGITVVLGANGVHNFARTGHFVPVIFASRTVSATTSNEWDGSLDSASADGTPASPWDAVTQAEERLRGADTPAIPAIDFGGLLRGAPGKLAVALADGETTFEYGYYGEREENRALDLLPVSFGMLGLLSLLGAVALVRARGIAALTPYLPLVLGALVTTVLYHPSSRYRLPMALPMLVLGAHGVMALARIPNVRTRIALGSIVALACAYFAFHTLGYELRHPGLWELRVAEGEAVRGDIGAARARVARARQVEPESPSVRERAEYVETMLPPVD